MTIRTFFATIEGTTPLMQHKFGIEAEQSLEKNTRTVKKEKEDPRVVAERFTYRENGAGSPIVHPGDALSRMLREAGVNHKQKGTRKSVKWIVPAAVRIPGHLELYKEDRKTRIDDFEVDSRSVVNQKVNARVMSHRPRFNAWIGKVELTIEDDILDPEFVLQLMNEGGQRVGIGSFRPEKGGPFGTFQVVEWEELNP